MKKRNVFLWLLLLMVVVLPTKTNAAIPVGGYGMTATECRAFADVFHTIGSADNYSYYYKTCYRANCTNGRFWEKLCSKKNTKFSLDKC